MKVGTAAFKSVAGYTPGPEVRQWLGTAAHYGFSAAMGVNYMLASEQAPDLRRGYGTVYGSLVWAAADEGVLPAAGLSKKPSEIPLGVHAYALGAHWVYGATLETCRRIAAAVLEAWDDRQTRTRRHQRRRNAPPPPSRPARRPDRPVRQGQSSGGSPLGAILTRRGSKRASGSTRSRCAAITSSMSL